MVNLLYCRPYISVLFRFKRQRLADQLQRQSDSLVGGREGGQDRGRDLTVISILVTSRWAVSQNSLQ